VSPLPVENESAVGPMRVVYCGFPDAGTADRVSSAVLRRRLAACANAFPISSAYWWRGRIERAVETVVLYKTAPKKVGALLGFLGRTHPYEVPDIFELDVPRAHPPYLDYLLATVDPPKGRGGRSARGRTRAAAVDSTRRAGRRDRGAAHPGRTRAPRHPRSTGTGTNR
jgi:periplasmic divalent cation tolerance protein